MNYGPGSRKIVAESISWHGEWPRIFPEDFSQWLLHRLVIYIVFAVIAVFICLFIAARMTGHSIEAYIFLLAVAVGVIGTKIRAQASN